MCRWYGIWHVRRLQRSDLTTGVDIAAGRGVWVCSIFDICKVGGWGWVFRGGCAARCSDVPQRRRLRRRNRRPKRNTEAKCGIAHSAGLQCKKAPERIRCLFMPQWRLRSSLSFSTCFPSLLCSPASFFLAHTFSTYAPAFTRGFMCIFFSSATAAFIATARLFVDSCPGPAFCFLL